MIKDIKLSSKNLSELVHILEASEGLAVLKTIDGKKGLAQLIYPACNHAEVESLLVVSGKNMRLSYNNYL